MARRRKTEKLVIPASAWTVKPLFPQQPGTDIVEEIRSHIRSGQPTYLWRGHTHSRPADGSAVEYLAEFDLDEERAAPCPICSPTHRKFHRNGLVAWFPETATISLIGPDCFKRISGGHNDALARFKERERAARDRAYLVDNAPLIDEYHRIASKNLRHATRIEGVRAWVHRQLRERQIDLWPHVRSGSLFVDEARDEVFQDRNGETRVRKITAPVLRSTIRGHLFFNPEGKLASRLLGEAVELLDQCRILPAAIEAMTDSERNILASRISRAFEKARDGRDALAEIVDGVSIATTAALRNWSSAGGPVRIHIRRTGGELQVGSSSDDFAVSRPPEGLDFAADPYPPLRSGAI